MKVLIIKLSSLGDIIHTFPAVTDALNHEIDIHWLVDDSFSDILKIMSNISIHRLRLRELKKNYMKISSWRNLISDLMECRIVCAFCAQFCG